MPRKDAYHEAVRIALENDGWTITDDPLTVATPGLDFHIDLGAVRDVIGAQKGGEQIAVEIKSLRNCLKTPDETENIRFCVADEVKFSSDSASYRFKI